jgi:putative phosphoserine phosphatase/1-acylglycerol-3-phosphate O-acyltransferase
LRPGVIDVVVLPPISVADWKLSELAERIEEVRQRVIHTLARWPTAQGAKEMR